MLDVAEDADVLALLEVHPDAEREPGVLLQLVGALGPEGLLVHDRDATP